MKVKVDNQLFSIENLIIEGIKLNSEKSILHYYKKYIQKIGSQRKSNLTLFDLKKHILFLLLYLSVNLSLYIDINNLVTTYIKKIEDSNAKNASIFLGENALIEILSLYISKNPFSNNDIILKSISYMKKHFDKNISLSDISKNSHVSSSYLSFLFSDSTGISIISYVNNLRIDKAKILLKTTNYSLEYISYTCGFKTQNYFSTVFKKNEKISPLKFRKEV